MIAISWYWHIILRVCARDLKVVCMRLMRANTGIYIIFSFFGSIYAKQHSCAQNKQLVVAWEYSRVGILPFIPTPVDVILL